MELQNISQTFQELGILVKVIENINLTIRKGEFIVFLGPNGCGKTTLLKIIAGLIKPTGGNIKTTSKELKDQKIGFVFQDYNSSMLPWRTALKNITLPLEVKGIDKKESERIALNLLKKVNIETFKDTFFYNLSGGMKQLVSICRALVYNPDLLILDEPFNSLDFMSLRKIESELLKIWEEKKKTTLFVSHDIDEAILLADKIVILSDKPMKIKEIIKVDFVRPRKLEIISTKKFIEIKKKIMKRMENEK